MDSQLDYTLIHQPWETGSLIWLLNKVKEYRDEGFKGPVYLMPVGGVESVYSLNNRTVAELAMKHGLRYSDRLQVPLFKNRWGT